MKQVWLLGMALGLSACLPEMPPHPSDAALNPPEQWLQTASTSHTGLSVT